METKLTDSKSKICSPQGDEHKIPLPEFLQRLGVDESGLSEQEASRRLQECGSNVLEETGKEGILSKYIRQFRNFFSILLTIGALLSFLGEYLEPGQGNLYIGIALAGVVILNSTFTFVQEYQAAKTMESFRQLLPPHSKVLRGGKIREILASELIVGDIILLEEGDKVPADGRLIETNSLKVDHSNITGEAEPQLRSLECTNSNILECRNMVFSGTLVQSGNGKAVVFGTGKLEIYLKGAPEVVVKMCGSVIDSGEVRKLTENEKKELLDRHLRLAERGERVIALAYRQVEEQKEYAEDFIFLGFIGIVDPPRPEAREAITKCHAAGIKVVMITGDHPVTAEAIAKKVGLGDSGNLEIITGDELNLLSRTDLALRLKNPSIVFARTSPVQKLKIVQLFQAEGEIVTMTGDGVNDAPAIKNADMGVAMGSGTDVAREATDMVLLDDNFATIVNAIEEGRTVFDNIKKFIVYIITHTIPEVLPYIAFIFFALPLPMPVQLILAIDLGTDMLPAIALGEEKGEEDIMKRPPRPRDEKLLTPQVLLTAYGIKGPIEAIAGFFCYFAVLFEGGWKFGEQLANNNPLYMQAITAFISAIIICQIANVFASRTRFQSVFTIGLFSNRAILLGIAIELLILALIIWSPFANLIFNTSPLDLRYVLLSVPFAIFLLGIDELRKYLLRRNVRWAARFLKW